MAGVKFSAIVAAGAISGTDTVIGVQTGPADVQYTVANLTTYVATHLGAASGTSLALNGATIGTNALAVKGTQALLNSAAQSASTTVGTSFQDVNGVVLGSFTTLSGVNGGVFNVTNGASSTISLFGYNGQAQALSFVANGNGAASSPSLTFNGTLFTGGTATTTFPQILVQPTGTSAVTTWSTSGTIIGANVVSGFAGNFLDFHVAGAASVFSVSSAGAVVAGGNVTGANLLAASGGNIFAANGNVTVQSAANTFNLRNAGTILSSPINATLQFGSADAASPVAQTLRAQSVVAGTAAANGQNWTLIGSLPTGTGTSGDIVIQTGVKTGSGTTQGIATTALTIKGETQNVVASAQIVLKGYTVATLPAGVTGGTAYVTDATAPTFLGVLVGGGATVTPVFYNGSAWVSY